LGKAGICVHLTGKLISVSLRQFFHCLNWTPETKWYV